MYRVHFKKRTNEKIKTLVEKKKTTGEKNKNLEKSEPDVAQVYSPTFCDKIDVNLVWEDGNHQLQG